MKTDRVTIDRNLLKCLCMGASAVLRKPEDEKKRKYLRKQINRVDPDVIQTWDSVEPY
jgi:hypothetical protein